MVKGLGPVKIKALLTKFKQPSKILNQDLHSLTTVQTVTPELATKIAEQVQQLQSYEDRLKIQFEQAEKLGARLIPLTSPDYPGLLKQSSISPEILYAIGDFRVLKSLSKDCVAIVGTRRSSTNGEETACRLAKEFSNSRWTVVSGLAKGIDSAAHRGAMEGRGTTVAVVGSGVDVVYPKESSAERSRILEKGLVVSEYSFGTRPTALNLKKRNKITVGLSKGLIIIQTGIKGGVYNAVIAAKEQRKPVFAISAGIENLEGNIDLISSQRAKPISSNGHAKDIIEMMKDGQSKLL
jgi:DNA processing protein